MTTTNVKSIVATRARRMRRPLRHGIATVELAMVLPVFLILVLGTIEVCQYMFMRQSAVIVAYEGARLAVRSRTASIDVVERCQEMLQQRRLQGAVVTITPTEILTAPTGTRIHVQIEVPHTGNSPTYFVLRNQGPITVNAYMLRE